ncbi:MAG TPA: hypothetical protein PKM27_07970 [Saprospiraceae bacterium]|nr:hypothetical protein [Saprospiraceae bacterium]HNT21091.1 hypothetical protein [Saprospiraceae bacterium]
MDLYIPEVFINARQEVYLILKNQGNTFIPHRNLELEVCWDDSSMVRFNLDSMDPHFRYPGDSSIFQLPFKVQRSRHLVKARVDRLNQLAESDEVHNVYSRTLKTDFPEAPVPLTYFPGSKRFEPAKYLDLILQAPFASGILWYEDHVVYPVAYWRKAWKDQLISKLGAIYSGTPVPLPDTLPWSLSRDVAFGVYLNYIAHSLWLEMEKEVPWSLRGMNPDDLSGLWDARQFFEWDSLSREYHPGYQISGAVSPQHPLVSYRFAAFLNGLPEDIPGSIRRFLDWGRAYLVHAEGKGLPVFQTAKDIYYPESGQLHAVNSCWASGGLMADYCRAFNIPVRRHNIELSNGIHNQLEFPTEAWYLVHADDMYDPLFYPLPGSISSTRMLFNKSEFNQMLRGRPHCLEDSCHSKGTQLSFERRRNLLSKALDLNSGYLMLQYDQGRNKFREFIRGDRFEKFLVPLFNEEEERAMMEKIKAAKPDYHFLSTLYERFEACKNNRR